MTGKMERINPAGLFDSMQGHHSHITTVESGKLAFFAGQVAWTADSLTAPESLSEQAKIVTSNLQAGLDAVGATSEDIVTMRVYVVDWTPETTEAVFPHLLMFLNGAKPGITGIGVQCLATPDLKLEVEMVVRVPE